MNTTLLITNAHIYGAGEDWAPGWLLAEGGQIEGLGRGRAPDYGEAPGLRRFDAGGMDLLPGFIDLHVHGAVGYETMDAEGEGLRAMARYYARHGVTGFLPTTWTATREAIVRALRCVAEVRAAGTAAGGAAILGAHVEGPYLNPERGGAQDARLIRRADLEEAREFVASGVVKLLALAPEFEENLALLDLCVQQGITVSAAHTDATYAQVEAAVRRGLSQSTHTFNAMRPLGHREPGTVGAVLTMAEVACELIADNIHVHPAAIKLLIEAKAPGGVILITDAVRVAGLPEGDHQLDDRMVTLRDGAVRLPNGNLAGSTLTMDRALRNVRAATGRTLRELWPTTSLNAARAIGVSASKGSLEVGKDADLVLLGAEGQVCLTVVDGEVAFEASV